MTPTINKLKPAKGKPAIDVLASLKTLKWKGIELPAISASWGLKKNIAEHSLSYHPGLILRNMGRDSQRLKYVVPLIQNMYSEKWVNAYSEIWPKLLPKLIEDTPGELIDPMFGPIHAEFFEGEYTISSENGRGGIVLTLQFGESTKIEPAKESQSLTIDSAKLQAEAFLSLVSNSIVEQVNLGTKESPLDILNTPSLVASKVMNKVNKVAATFDRLATKLDRQVSAIEELRDVRNWPVIRSGKNLARKARDGSERLLHVPKKRMRVEQITQEITISSLAKKLGVTQAHLLEKNPDASDNPVIQPGTAIFYQEP